jgi:multiple sugar transport system substrate-binding protein
MKQVERFFPLGLPGVLGGLLFLGSLLGCSSKPQPSPSSAGTATGPIIRIACAGEPVVSLLRQYGRRWASRAGTGVEICRYGPEQGPETASECDLWVIEPAQMPHYAARGELLEVPAALRARGSSFSWDSLLSLFRNKLLVWGEKAFALPLLQRPLFCYYRSDLMADSASINAFQERYHRQLKPPETWEEFVEIAEFFNGQNRPGIKHPCASLPALPADDRYLDWEYYCLAAPFARQAAREDDPPSASGTDIFSFHYDLRTGAVRINTPGFLHALEIMQKLQACRATGQVAEPPVAFERGEAVLCLGDPTWIARFSQNQGLHGKFGFHTIPGSRLVFGDQTGKPIEQAGVNYVPYLGAGDAVTVVPRTSTHPQEAFAFAAFLADPKTSLEIVVEPEWGGGAFRREHLENRVGWQGFNVGPHGTEALVDCIRRTVAFNQIKNPVVRLRIPGQERHMQAMDREIRAALARGKNARQALDDAAQHWLELDAGLPLEQRIINYRLSLGLAP